MISRRSEAAILVLEIVCVAARGADKRMVALLWGARGRAVKFTRFDAVIGGNCDRLGYGACRQPGRLAAAIWAVRQA